VGNISSAKAGCPEIAGLLVRCITPSMWRTAIVVRPREIVAAQLVFLALLT
jgi:hypothetical protein